MKRILWLNVLVSVVLFCFIGSVLGEDLKPPKKTKEQVDLGNVQLGQTVKVSFLVTNVGDQPLRFSDKPYVEVVEGC